jgi:hypothetical protein
MVTKCFENKDFIEKIQEGLVFFFIVLGVGGGVVFLMCSHQVHKMFPLGSQNVSILFMKELAKNQQFKVSSFALVMVQSIESWGESSVSFSNILGLG